MFTLSHAVPVEFWDNPYKRTKDDNILAAIKYARHLTPDSLSARPYRNLFEPITRRMMFAELASVIPAFYFKSTSSDLPTALFSGALAFFEAKKNQPLKMPKEIASGRAATPSPHGSDTITSGNEPGPSADTNGQAKARAKLRKTSDATIPLATPTSYRKTSDVIQDRDAAIAIPRPGLKADAEGSVTSGKKSRKRKAADSDDIIDTANEDTSSPKKSKKSKRVDTGVEPGNLVKKGEDPKKKAKKKRKADTEATVDGTVDQNNTRKKESKKTKKHSEAHIGLNGTREHDQKSSPSLESPVHSSQLHSSTGASRASTKIQSEASDETGNSRTKKGKRAAAANVRDAEHYSEDGDSTVDFNRDLPREHGFPTSGKRMPPTAEKARACGGDVRSVGIKTEVVDVIELTSGSDSGTDSDDVHISTSSARRRPTNPNMVLQQVVDTLSQEVTDLQSILDVAGVNRAQVKEKNLVIRSKRRTITCLSKRISTWRRKDWRSIARRRAV